MVHSRIENGLVNPTKETIIAIAKALNLKTEEIASLFGIELDKESLEEVLSNLKNIESLEDLIFAVTNKLIFKIGYLASMMWLIRDKKIFAAGITNSNISKAVHDIIDKDFSEVALDFDNNDNLTVQAILEKTTKVTNLTSDYTVPSVTQEQADLVQEETGDKSNCIVPMISNGKVMGAMVYVKKIEDDFSSDKEMLQGITNYVSNCLYKLL
ncbi:helix-turn-helix domain-containing protein [Candidatus Dojkabacteria bacterium]|uniref:Helix-turn-helix domain-containing protein n=1 Tax=Candidatus Dojkabacteria bacterium TaxID=2099670 RepID=A0A955IBC2_9BACT|nr:helix-turn-helix domain-containing protein [Candidatus Dojkabacteria bacterium]